jgi:hypothetical protein
MAIRISKKYCQHFRSSSGLIANIQIATAIKFRMGLSINRKKPYHATKNINTRYVYSSAYLIIEEKIM